MTALCNQLEAFASDLGDDQSCYLCLKWLPFVLTVKSVAVNFSVTVLCHVIDAIGM